MASIPTSSLRRLASDHAALHRAPLPPYYLHAPGSMAMPDDLSQLTILLAGPPGTPYEEGLWRLQLRMPPDYPRSPPRAHFRTKIWHPNVDENTGAVCLDTLKRDWTPTLTLRDILITISCLLISPNPDSALNSSAGKLLQEDFALFAQQARLMSSIHAPVPSGLRDAAICARHRGEERPADPDTPEDSDNEIENDENVPEKESGGSPSESAPSGQQRPLLNIRRSTILGKRPLADLPTPPEPESDNEDDPFAITKGKRNSSTDSERNIAANTPNLSSDMAHLGLRATSTTTGVAGCGRSSLTAHSRGATTVTQEPSAKRLCGIHGGVSVFVDGKENELDGLENGQGRGINAATQPKPDGTLVGLGIRTPSIPQAAAAAAVVLASTKKAVNAAPTRQAPKSRMGVRRL